MTKKCLKPLRKINSGAKLHFGLSVLIKAQWKLQHQKLIFINRAQKYLHKQAQRLDKNSVQFIHVVWCSKHKTKRGICYWMQNSNSARRKKKTQWKSSKNKLPSLVMFFFRSLESLSKEEVFFFFFFWSILSHTMTSWTLRLYQKGSSDENLQLNSRDIKSH